MGYGLWAIGYGVSFNDSNVFLRYVDKLVVLFICATWITGEDLFRLLSLIISYCKDFAVSQKNVSVAKTEIVQMVQF